ncbi:ribosomal RNA small subunit methyltransferase A [Candidatus Saccharibacteria bacterium]|nr:ribosomal RNA small subunit methyltransferase A [Candidatus Saccharibacteria bacterium]
MTLQNNKSLGQHWLKDRSVLAHIADCADLQPTDTVLEIGPGLGTLTSELLRRVGQVIAVEFDADLARKLPAQFPGKNLTVVSGDILKFDLTNLPTGYKVVANIPYYITNKIVKLFTTSANKPKTMVLLVQKEVAERLAAGPGQMSILSISAQVFADVKLGDIVPAGLFTPPPKVDSRVVILNFYDSPIFGDLNEGDFFRVVKAGFSSKRKKLRTSLAGGLALPKSDIESILIASEINPDDRAEALEIADWVRLTRTIMARA